MADGDSSGGGSHSGGSDSTSGAGRLRLINLVIMQVVELNRQRAIILADLHYSSDLTKSAYTPFYRIFLEVYKLTCTLVSKELQTEIDKWVEMGDQAKRSDAPVTIRKLGLDLSSKLISELSGLGFLQLFEEPVAPPFIFDFDLLTAKDKIAAAEIKAKEEEAQAAARALLPPEPITTEEATKKKKKRDR